MELFNHMKDLYSQSISFRWYMVLGDLVSPWQVPQRRFGLGCESEIPKCCGFSPASLALAAYAGLFQLRKWV